MPRKARIDAPGALHHIIGRGIERRRIFRDDHDRKNFINRLGTILSETETPCYAWALIPNHFHLLLKTGHTPIATVMRRLLTGYAVSFNLRHQRHGHVFQNRYKSILCQEDTYLKELVRYIHLNPLRAGLVSTHKELDQYLFCGHSSLVGTSEKEWHSVNEVLGFFGISRITAKKTYQKYVNKGLRQGRKPELMGGGLVRSAGGWDALKALRTRNMHLKSDERILGDSDFVESVLAASNENLENRYQLKARGFDFKSVANRVSRLFNIDAEELLLPGKQRQRVLARSVLAYWAVRELGMTGTDVGHRLGLSQPAVSRALDRGERFVLEGELKLIVKNA
ncbi:MAG: transposase [Deltaproteobacteria bacterium]|nr:transposase [Deltaproteobacteria bacterium]